MDIKGKTFKMAQGQVCRLNQENSLEVPWVSSSDLRLWHIAKKAGCYLARLSFSPVGETRNYCILSWHYWTWMNSDAGKIKPFFSMFVPNGTVPFSVPHLLDAFLGWKYVFLQWFSKLVLMLSVDRRLLFCHHMFVNLIYCWLFFLYSIHNICYIRRDHDYN